jgi:hypothetical protein
MMSHAPSWNRLLAVIALLLVGAACNSSLDCRRVATRLLSDCRLTFGAVAEGGACVQARAASVAAGGDRAPVPPAEDLSTRLCEVAEPAGEESCYLTARCEDLALGACAPPAEDATQAGCRAGCQEALPACLAGCDGPVAVTACEDCVIACNEAVFACRRGC